jgi:hypothetical protein
MIKMNYFVMPIKNKYHCATHNFGTFHLISGFIAPEYIGKGPCNNGCHWELVGQFLPSQ